MFLHRLGLIDWLHIEKVALRADIAYRPPSARAANYSLQDIVHTTLDNKLHHAKYSTNSSSND
jgi:hypothetical protein